VNKRMIVLVAAVALAIVGVSSGLLALFRLQQAREFGEPHQVRSRGGSTNYVVRLLETVVGKTESGYVLIVYVRLENSNSFDIDLHRDWFVLVDRHRKYYSPSISGTQGESIKVLADSVLQREMLSFTVPNDTLAGGIALVIGQNYTVLIKDRSPFRERLSDGEFRSFRRHRW
jgi:hypothetical protein